MIRRATLEDMDAVHAVCTGTGDGGEDATHLYPDDPRALGRLYTQPYLELEPDFSFVLCDEEGVFGYTFATPNSKHFYERMGGGYMDRLRSHFPRPAGSDRASWSPAESVYEQYHTWEGMWDARLEHYPAHLHIDILKRGQGQGFGEKLMARQLTALREAGCEGVHLCLAAKNHRAHRFYVKIGFHELFRTEDDVVMGMCLEGDGGGGESEGGGKEVLPVGMLEGFYGKPWSPEERTSAIALTASLHCGLYFYAPKDDPSHRVAWRRPLGVAEGESLGAVCGEARRRGVEVVFGLSPGLDAVWSDGREVERAVERLRQAAGFGVTRFAILFDDIDPSLCPRDAAAFHSQPALAHAAFANAVFLKLSQLLKPTQSASLQGVEVEREEEVGVGMGGGGGGGEEREGGEELEVVEKGGDGLGDTVILHSSPPSTPPPHPPSQLSPSFPRFLVCPTEYCGRLIGSTTPSTSSSTATTSPYLSLFGRSLLPEIAVLWTGPDVISASITTSHIKSTRSLLSGSPSSPSIYSPTPTTPSSPPSPPPSSLSSLHSRYSAFAPHYRRQVVLWDNLFANDYDEGKRVFLGPYCGREVGLLGGGKGAVAGVLLNPNCQFQANFVPFVTLAQWATSQTSHTPHTRVYDAESAAAAAVAKWCELGNWDAVEIGKDVGMEGGMEVEGGGASGGSEGGGGGGDGVVGGEKTTPPHPHPSTPPSHSHHPKSPPHSPMRSGAQDAAAIFSALFHTPFSYGNFAKQLLLAARSAFSSALALYEGGEGEEEEEKGGGGGDRRREVFERDLNEFEALAMRVTRAQERITALKYRPLCHALYRYAWDVKEAVELLTQILQHAKTHPIAHVTSPPPTLPPPSHQPTPFRSPYHISGPIGGGIITHLHSFVHFDPETHTFHVNDPRQWWNE